MKVQKQANQSATDMHLEPLLRKNHKWNKKTTFFRLLCILLVLCLVCKFYLRNQDDFEISVAGDDPPDQMKAPKQVDPLQRPKSPAITDYALLPEAEEVRQRPPPADRRPDTPLTLLRIAEGGAPSPDNTGSWARDTRRFFSLGPRRKEKVPERSSNSADDSDAGEQSSAHRNSFRNRAARMLHLSKSDSSHSDFGRQNSDADSSEAGPSSLNSMIDTNSVSSGPVRIPSEFTRAGGVVSDGPQSDSLPSWKSPLERDLVPITKSKTAPSTVRVSPVPDSFSRDSDSISLQSFHSQPAAPKSIPVPIPISASRQASYSSVLSDSSQPGTSSLQPFPLNRAPIVKSSMYDGEFSGSGSGSPRTPYSMSPRDFNSVSGSPRTPTRFVLEPEELQRALDQVSIAERKSNHWKNWIYSSATRHWYSFWCRWDSTGKLLTSFHAERKLEGTGSSTIHRNVYHYGDERGTIEAGQLCGPWEINEETCSRQDGLIHPSADYLRMILVPGGAAWVSTTISPTAPSVAEMFINFGTKVRISVGVVYTGDRLLKSVALIREDIRDPSPLWDDDTVAHMPTKEEFLTEWAGDQYKNLEYYNGYGHGTFSELSQVDLLDVDFIQTRIANPTDDDVIYLWNEDKIAAVVPKERPEACVIAIGWRIGGIITMLEVTWTRDVIHDVRIITFRFKNNGLAGLGRVQQGAHIQF